MNDQLRIYVEILSCRDLLIGDVTSSDPYVKVKLGKKEIHETKHLKQTLNPVFTESEENACIVQCTRNELTKAYGLLFKVKDWDLVGSNDELGSLLIQPERLLKGTGKPTEYKIRPPKRMKDKSAGYLTIAFRVATDEDEEAMRNRPNYRRGIFSVFAQPKRSNSLSSNDDTSSIKSGKSSVPTIAASDAAECEDLFNDKTAKKVNASGTKHSKKSAIDDGSSVTSGVTLGTSASAQPTGERSTEKNANKAKKPDPDPETTLKVFIQIKSCRELPIGDVLTSDPYVVVRMGKKEIHRTAQVLKTTNPHFKEEHNNVLLVNCTAKDVTDAGGLTFIVKDKDFVGTDDELGKARIPPKTFFHPPGDLREYKLKPTNKKDKAGYIRLRIRGATPDDEAKVKKVNDAFANGSMSNRIKRVIPGNLRSRSKSPPPVRAATADEEDAESPPEIVLSQERSMPPTQQKQRGRSASPKRTTTTTNEAPMIHPKRPMDTSKKVEKLKIQTMSSIRNLINPDKEKDARDTYTKVEIRANGVKQILELFKIARKRDAFFQSLEIHNMKVSDTKEDFEFVEELSGHVHLRKLHLFDFEVSNDRQDKSNPPPLLDILGTFTYLQELEMFMKKDNSNNKKGTSLPASFTSSVAQYSPNISTLIFSRLLLDNEQIKILFHQNDSIASSLRGIVLWNVDLDFQQLKLICEYLKTNKTLKRFELWCSEICGDSNFGVLLGEMLEHNTALERMVLSHVGLYGGNCIALMDALRKNKTLKDLTLLSVSDGDKDKVSKNVMHVMAVNHGIGSLSVTYNELKEQDLYDVSKNMRRKLTLQKLMERKRELQRQKEKVCLCI